MKVVVLYRRDSDYGRSVEEFIHEFRRAHGSTEIEEVSLDTPEGAEIQKVYGLVDQPAILALKDDGSMLNMWQGKTLPLMNDVASYVALG